MEEFIITEEFTDYNVNVRGDLYIINKKEMLNEIDTSIDNEKSGYFTVTIEQLRKDVINVNTIYKHYI